MTVAELMSILADLPPDAEVYREGGEYRGDERKTKAVTYRVEPCFGIPGNSVLIE